MRARSLSILAAIASVIVFVAAVGFGWVDRTPCQTNQTVMTAGQLRSAIACARKNGTGTIKLGAGAQLGELSIRNARFRKLELVSSDPQRPAHFSVIEIGQSSNIRVHSALVTGHRPPDQRYAVYVQSSKGIVLDGLHVRGIVRNRTEVAGTAMMIRNSQDIRINHSSISHYTHAIALLNVSDVQINRNYFSDLRIDGVRAGKVENLLVEGNVFTNFHPQDGDHPDAMQLWTRNEQAASSGIRIVDNIVVRGNGGATQGIFLRDTEGLPFRDVTIAGNILIGTMYAGIAVDGFKDLTIRNNVVIPLAPYLTRIHIESGRNATVSNNIAGKFLIETKAWMGGNSTLPIAQPR